MTASLSGFGFGQTERLTRRIAGLIRSYRPGIGILKEFLQNADDAGATELRVVLDLRTHRGDRLPDPRMGPLCGPALLLRNNARFTIDDLTAIRRISESSKYHSGPKTGRFGLGFNTAYNVTDHPSFVTNDAMYCFDPHQDTVAQGDDHGWGWRLAEAWLDFPDWPRLFASAGLSDDCRDLDGTIFRLPFRPEGRSSEICDRPFGAAEARAIFAEASEAGSALLLFTRNLESLMIEEIDDAGRREVLRIELLAGESFRESRAALKSALDEDLPALISTWLADGRPLPSRLCSSIWRVTTPSGGREEHWRVAMGLARGAGDRLLKAAKEMMTHREKAVPWIGLAARLDGETARPVSGHLYCGLPLPVPNEQPVHINGYFDLDSSRQHLTSTGDASGSATEARVGWNAALLEEGAATSWAALLADLAGQGVEGLYSLFPALPANNEPLARMVRRAYAELAGRAVIRVSACEGTRLVSPRELRLPMLSGRMGLSEPLAADGLPMPSPMLPATVESNFGNAIAPFTPADLREMLRMPAQDIDCEIAEAPRASLRRREWIERLLAYALSDGSKELTGLPLLILCDGRLHTIGAGTRCFATDELRALFPGKLKWFVEPSFASATGLTPIPEIKLLEMGIGLVVSTLSALLGTDRVRDWLPDGQEPPNRDWLRRLLDYLVRHELDAPQRAKLAELPLFPASDGRLYASLDERSPLIVAKGDAKPALLAALRKLDIIVLDVDTTLAPGVSEFLRRTNLLRTLNGPGLADALYGCRGEVDTLKELAVPLLDYLAEPRWTYTAEQRQRLAAVPLFPSDHGTIPLDGSSVFLPSQFRPPELALKVCLLAEERRWGQLYEKLGVTEIDASGYLKNVLLPEITELQPHDLYRALEWLRDMWQLTAGQLGDAEARTIRRRISALPLVWGTDGSLHPISALHDPDSTPIRDVLGAEAIYPSMDRYAGKRDAWLGFFRQFGLIRDLSTNQLVRYVRMMADRGLVAASGLQRVFRHLDETVTEEKAREALAALQDVAWLPAKQSSTAHGFVAPDSRLYKPEELALNDRLVGSQLPVLDWKPQRPATMTALRIRTPAASVVLAHFQCLLREYGGEVIADESHPGLGKNFHDIYRYLDRFCQEPFVGKPRLSAEDEDLIEEIAERPCIWDPDTARLWRPMDVFAAPVPFFAPLRASLRVDGGERFLARLGRTNEPSSGDFARFLKDLRSLAAGAPLDETQRRQAAHALNQVAQDHDAQEPLPLLTTDGRLVDSTDVYWDDAPWLRGRLGDGLAMVALEVPTPLLRGLKVRRLSEEVEERIALIDRHGVAPAAASACSNLALRVGSPQFAAGLERLVRHEHGADAEFVTVHLAIEPVARVEVELVIARTGSLGHAEVTQYFDDARPCLYLVVSSEARMVKWVAQAVSRLLGTNALESTAASLEHILACEPGEIDTVLNEDRIPRIVSEVAEIEWLVSEQDVQQTDEGSPDEDEGGPDEDEGSPDEDEGSQDAARASDQRGDVVRALADAVLPTGRRVGGEEPGKAFVPEPDDTPSSVPASSGASGNYGSTAHASRQRLASDALWLGASESRPPIEPGEGASRTRRDGVGGELPRLKSESDEVDEAKREIEERAIEISMRHELERGRSPKRMPDKNPGHDIQSIDANEEIRYIEVKGIAGDWRNHPVQLTLTQFEQAHALQDGYWLYVVERVSGTPRLHCIRDPAQYILGFAVDSKWARFAEAAPSITTPKEGLLLFQQQEILGRITRVKAAGGLFRVSYRAENGMEITLTFQPGKHTLKDTTHGTNDP